MNLFFQTNTRFPTETASSQRTHAAESQNGHNPHSVQSSKQKIETKYDAKIERKIQSEALHHSPNISTETIQLQRNTKIQRN